MHYRVVYAMAGWRKQFEGAGRAEYQQLIESLDQRHRLVVDLVRYGGTMGVPEVRSAVLEVAYRDQWQQQRWRILRRLQPRDVLLVGRLRRHDVIADAS